MKVLIAALLLTAPAIAGDSRQWKVRVIETSPTSPARVSTPSRPATSRTTGKTKKLSAELVEAMVDHSKSMANYALKYGVEHHGNRAVANAHRSLVYAVNARRPDAEVRARYVSTVEAYEKWRTRHRNQTVTDRNRKPLNR